MPDRLKARSLKMSISPREVVELAVRGDLNDRLRRGYRYTHAGVDPIWAIKEDYFVHGMAIVSACLAGVIWLGLGWLQCAGHADQWEIYMGVIVGVMLFSFALVVAVTDVIAVKSVERAEFPSKLNLFLTEFAKVEKPAVIADDTEDQLLVYAKRILVPLAGRMLELNEQSADEDVRLAEAKRAVDRKVKSLYDLLADFNLTSPAGYQPYYDAAREQRRLRAEAPTEPAL